MNFEFRKHSSEKLEKDPQIEHNWRHYRRGLDSIKKIEVMIDSFDSIQTESMFVGDDVISASLEMEDSLKNLYTVSLNRKNKIMEEVSSMLRNAYGDDLEFEIDNDKTLKLNNGLIYGED